MENPEQNKLTRFVLTEKAPFLVEYFSCYYYVRNIINKKEFIDVLKEMGAYNKEALEVYNHSDFYIIISQEKKLGFGYFGFMPGVALPKKSCKRIKNKT